MKHVRNVGKLYTFVYGKRSQAPNGSLCGAPNTLDIFVFHCDTEKSCDRVRKYIEDNSTKVMHNECVPSENARYRSVHVSKVVIG